MKTIISTNNDILYKNFTNTSINSWRSIGFDPVLVKVNGNKVKIESLNLDFKLNFSNEEFATKTVRLLVPYFFSSEMCFLSDIDIIPLNEDYFNLKNYSSTENIYIFRSNEIKNKQIPICWNAATGKIWARIFNIDNLNDIIQLLNNWYVEASTSNYLITYFDQLMLYKYIKKYESFYPNSVVYLDDETKNFKRLDRKDYQFALKNIFYGTKYTDFHMPRPYHKNYLIINLIKNSYLNKSKLVKFMFKQLTIFFIIVKRLKNKINK